MREKMQTIQLSDSKLARVISVDKPKQTIFQRFVSTNKQPPEVIQLDKFGNFKMYEQFLDLQVGDIREIPTLTTHQTMLKEYLENWLLVFEPSQMQNSNVDFCNSIRNSIYVIHDSQRIEEKLSTLEDKKDNFLVFPHLVMTPLNSVEQSLVSDAVILSSSGKKLIFMDFMGSYVEKKNNQYAVNLMDLTTGSITEFLIDETRKKDLAAILGSPSHFGLAHETNLTDKLAMISQSSAKKQSIQDYGIPIKQCHFVVPKLFPMFLFAYQFNNLKQQNPALAIEEMDVKQWMNRFHEAAVHRVSQLQYPEKIIYTMDRVYEKVMQEESLLTQWQETLNEMEKNTVTSHSSQEKTQESWEELASNGITIEAASKNGCQLLEEAAKKLETSRGLVLTNEIEEIKQSLENSQAVLAGKTTVLQQLKALKPGNETSFLITSHQIAVHSKADTPVENQEIGCVVRKKSTRDFSISIADPTGYYQKFIHANGMVPCVHEFKVSVMKHKELASILMRKNCLGKANDFEIQRKLSRIGSGSGEVTKYVIGQMDKTTEMNDFSHFSEAIKFAIFTSTHQLGHYVYLGDCHTLEEIGKLEIAECIKKERTMRINQPAYFEKTKYQHNQSLGKNTQQKQQKIERRER